MSAPTDIRNQRVHVMDNHPVLFEKPTKGTVVTNETGQRIFLQYKHPNGELYCGDSIEWLKTLRGESVDMIFADPPYNIKKAEWDTFESQKAYIDWSIQWIREAARVLTSTGTLYVCGFSEILADIKFPASEYFAGCRWLVWHYKNKAYLGNDYGRSHESILHFRRSRHFTMNVDYARIPYGAHTLKYPVHPQAETSQYNKGNGNGEHNHWTPHPMGAKPKDVIEIPTTCNGSGECTPHPTQKPEELLRKFIMASSNRGDTVLDPFSGSGTTLVAAEQLGRNWLGCELNADYNQWAITRLEHAKQLTDTEWFWFDRNTEERRKSIR